MKCKTSKLTKLNVGYQVSAGRIGCIMNNDIVNDIEKTDKYKLGSKQLIKIFE